MTCFSHRPSFACLCCLKSDIYAYITSFFAKNLYFTKNSFISPSLVTSYFPAHPRTLYTSPNIGGTDAWAVPHLKFSGQRPPQSLLSLRQCLQGRRCDSGGKVCPRSRVRSVQLKIK